MRFSPEESVVVLGSARSRGNTRRAVEAVLAGRRVEVVDLSRLRISPYDYQHRNARDDFIPLIESLAAKDFWILATPVYWYSMSAQLKLFVDRLGDLFDLRTDLGQRLPGKSLAVVATGSGPKLPHGFQSPFRLACEYLGLRYAGAFYGRFRDDERPSPGVAARAGRAGAKWLS